ncbi:MAG: cysteine desulfurase family protein [Opitutae bacterium]
MHYFDYNSTVPVTSDARTAWTNANAEHWFNPSSPYLLGSSVRVRIDEARASFASLLGCQPKEIIFNSGATEGNNTAINYFSRTCERGKRILVSSIEHPSVREPASRLDKEKIQWVGVGSDGVVDLELIQDQITSGCIHAVSVMAANNETGVIQPWMEIQDICRSTGTLFHCDAVQWIGKLNCKDLGVVDFVTGCAHKFGGPKGCGFLKIPESSDHVSILQGGAQEGGYRAGTEDYPSIISMLAALNVANPIDSKLRDSFETELSRLVSGIKVVGGDSLRLANTSMLIMPQFENHRWVNRLSRRGFLVSTGSACASAKEGPSYVLNAMGIAQESASRAVRVSSSSRTDSHAWQLLAEAFCEVFLELQAEKPSSGIIAV